MRKLALVPGIILLLAAFVGGAAEIAARSMAGGGGWSLSAVQVWQILRPESLAEFRAGVMGRWLWLAEALPAWALFGLPGGLLFWIGRGGRGEGDDGPDEESMFLYDELARRAHEEGYLDDDYEPDTHKHLMQDGEEEEKEADDRAPTEHGYHGFAIREGEDWTPPADQDDTGEKEPLPRLPAQPIPKPPALGEGRWIAPPPAEGSGKEKE